MRTVRHLNPCLHCPAGMLVWAIPGSLRLTLLPGPCLPGHGLWAMIIPLVRSNPEKYALQYIRNLHFRNDLKEFAITGIYNFIADGRNSNARAKFTPYVFGGLALVAHSPEAITLRSEFGSVTITDLSKWVKLQPLHTEGQGQPGYQKALFTGDNGYSGWHRCQVQVE